MNFNSLFIFTSVAHETAIFCNPQTHSFTGERKNLIDHKQTNT